MNEPVIFVAAPYLSVVRPALGISTLKSGLAAVGVESRIEYLNMRFADMAGVDICEYIAERTPTHYMVGEWTFAQALNGRRDSEEQHAYVRWLESYFTEGKVARIHALRDRASEFVELAAAELARSGARIIGFSSSFQQNCASLAIARRLSDLVPETIICFGGANCEGTMGRTLLEAYPFIDYVFSGESDRTFPPAVLRMLNGDFPAGDGMNIFARNRMDSMRATSTTFSFPGFPNELTVVAGAPEPALVQNMDELPIPDFADYFATMADCGFRDRVDVGLLFETSRGCWWGAKKHCRFCGLNGTGMTYRVKSPAKILDEIETLYRRWGVPLFEAADNIMNMQHVESVFGLLADRPHPFIFFYEVKSNMGSEHLARIARGGVSWIQPGIESLDDDILALMEKGVTMLQNIRLLRTCQEIGIRAIWNLLWGFPGERAGQYERMAEIMPLLEHLDPPSGIARLRLDRFSPYYERAVQLGFVDVVPMSAYAVIHDVDPRLLPDLAYFFDGTPTDVDPGDYIAPARSAVACWKEQAAEREHPSMLLLIRIGPLTAIKDTRRCSARRWHYVEPVELLVLEAFREPASVDRVLAEMQKATGSDPRGAFDLMVDRGYLLVDRGKALSLVVETGLLVRDPLDLDRYPGGSLSEVPVDGDRATPIERDILAGEAVE